MKRHEFLSHGETTPKIKKWHVMIKCDFCFYDRYIGLIDSPHKPVKTEKSVCPRCHSSHIKVLSEEKI